MNDCRFSSRSLLVALLTATLIWTVLGSTAVAQTGGGAQSPRFVDKKLGEEEEILRRNQWFYEPRRAGTSSDEELWKLRLEALEQTRQAVALQRATEGLGPGGSGMNVWVSKGPSPSTFGGWAFGTVSGRIQAIASDWDGGVLYVGATAGGAWKSTNDGLSWTPILDDAGTLPVGAITVDPNDSNVLWVGTGDNLASCESYFGIGLLRSPDAGETWELRNGSPGNDLDDLSGFGSVAVDPRDSNKLVVGGKYRGCTNGNQQNGGIFTTDDGGATWTERLSSTQVHEIARDPSVPDILWASTAKGVYKSADNGQSWTLQTANGLPNGNLGRTELAISPSNPNVVYVLYDTPSDQFWRTTDGGASWSLRNGDACDGQCWYNMVIRVDPNDENTIYRGTIKIFKSVNGGSSWSVLTNNWGGSQQVHQDTHSLLMHPTEPDTFYVGSDGGLWKSENGGSSFINKNGNLSVTQFYAIDVDQNDPERICGGAQDNSSLARDGDDVWARQAVTGDGFVCYIDPVDDNYAYITSYPSGGFPNVWRSSSGLFGSFNDITNGNGIIGGDRIAWVTPYTLDPTSPNIIYLGTHRIYRSTNRGNSWTQVGPNDATNGSTLRVLEVNRGFPSVVYSGSDDGAVWRSANGGNNWTNISSGLPSRAINDIAADPDNAERAFAVVSGFNTSHLWEWNLSTGWVARGADLPNVPANTVLMLGHNELLVGTDTGVFRSIDGGQFFLPFMFEMPIGLVVTDLKYSEQQDIVTAGTYARGAWQVNIGPAQPFIEANSVELPLIQIDGDGDADIEPGETWSVRPILRNAGLISAAEVTARLASTTPGLTILNPGAGEFGQLDPGQSSPVQTAFEFSVDPGFACGTALSFDLVDITSSTAPGSYDDELSIYTTTVQGGIGAPITDTVVDEDLDPTPPGWEHEAVAASIGLCSGIERIDEWQVATKDAEHGNSFHCGSGPGGAYGRNNFAWLHPEGKDSEAGPGILIPSDVIGASLRIVHWYDTAHGTDGAQVAIDDSENGEDIYAPLRPIQGYTGTLTIGSCNGLEGKEAFHGSSNGWIESQFDLTPYRGNRVYLAFVFGSGTIASSKEGWYIDDIRIEFQYSGSAICDIAHWPGEVSTSSFNLTGPGTIEASWGDSCNIGDFGGQTYSIQAGDLDALRASGTYSHTPVDGLCDLTSPATFASGSGNQYYVIVPVGDGREGSAGLDSTGTERPQPGATCGLQRATCP